LNKNNLYAVILAGGSGTRLQPISTEEKPKQFLSFTDSKTFLEQAVERVALTVCKNNIFVATNERYKHAVLQTVTHQIGGVITEPAKKNTAPAIALSCLQLLKKNSDAVVLFCPSDAFIPEKESVKDYFEKAFEYAAQNNQIVLFGLQPNRAAIEYGYIEFESRETMPPFFVQQFHEKPDSQHAQQYYEKENMLWNIGMFCARASVFLQVFEKHAPTLLKKVQNYVDGTGSYEEVQSISFDYAILEKSGNALVFPVDFEWYDVGNVDIFLKLQKKLAGEIGK